MIAINLCSGYSDQAAAVEARRCMLQITAAPFMGMPIPVCNSTVSAGYDRSSLLSGVKIPMKPVSLGWNMPLLTAPVVNHRATGKNAIPVTLKTSKSKQGMVTIQLFHIL